MLERGRGSVLVLSAIFLWSSLGVVIRLAAVDVHLIIFYSNLVSLVPIGVYMASKRLFANPGVSVPRLLLLGPVTLANTFTFFYALQNTSISNALMTHYTAPVFVAFFAFLFLGERVSKLLAVSLMLSSAGLVIMLGINPLEIASVKGAPDALGILSGTVSGLAYAFLVIMIRQLAPKAHPVAIAFYQNLMLTVLLLPFVDEFPAHAAWSFLLVGILHSTIAPVLYIKGMQHIQANRAAVLGYLEPVCAIIFGMIVLHEYPSIKSLAGGILIILSGVMIIREGRA